MTPPLLRVVFTGCVELSFQMLQEVLSSEHAEVVGIVSRESSDFHSDFRSLLPEGKRRGIPTFSIEGNRQEGLAKWIQDLRADVVYCFGWPYLLKKDILEAARLGVVGYHPAELPKNRGRHPLIWAVALGLERTASTFFFMDEGADSGDILDQKQIEIGKDDVGALYARLIPLSRSQVKQFTEKLRLGSFERRKQDPRQANEWRKRSRHDGQIDWRMSAESIHNLVRALTRPYVGAHVVFNGQDCKVWKSEILVDVPAHLEPGKVLSDSPSGFIVKCGQGAIRLVEYDFPEIPIKGSYL